VERFEDEEKRNRAEKRRLEEQSKGKIQEVEREGGRGAKEEGGGDDSSPGYQPRWAGLLWGWQCDTYAVTHTRVERCKPSRCLYVSSCCEGGWETIQGYHWHTEFTVMHLQLFPSDTHTHTHTHINDDDGDGRTRGLIKTQGMDGWQSIQLL